MPGGKEKKRICRKRKMGVRETEKGDIEGEDRRWKR